MKNDKKYKLFGAALCLVIAGVCVGVGITMRGQGYSSWWLFAACGVLFSVLLYVLGVSVMRYSADAKESVRTDNDKTPPPETDEDLKKLHAMGLHISEEDYYKIRKKIDAENRKE